MKTKFILSAPIICFFLMSVHPFSSHTSERLPISQDLQIVGIYDGNEGFGYNFITKNKETGTDYTMTFQKVNDRVMKEYDLDEELFLSQNFEVTYTVETVVSKDEDGFDQEEEVYTITRLKAL